MIILYNPPSSPARKPVLPMSLLALGAVLEGHYEYRIIDANLEDNPLATLLRAIDTDGAHILAVTVMPGPQLMHAVPLCRQIKMLRPQVVIIWGGYFPGQHYESCVNAVYIDYIIRGHGELIFKNLVDQLHLNKEHPKTSQKPRMWQGAQPYINKVAAPAPIPHPDHLPDFPYHRVKMERYIRPTFMGTRTLPHHSSYGCPFFCNFCAVVNMVHGKWLAQSAQHVADVTERLVREWGVNAVDFYDNNFFTQEARTVEFAERITPLHIGWWGEGRIDTLHHYSEKSWRTMRESGLRMVFLGAESGSNETLQRMNKGGNASIEKTIDIVGQMKEHHIVPELSFVVGNPPDPEEDLNHTIAFIRRIKRLNPATEIILYMYTPVPLAGELYEEAKTQGFHFPQTLEEWIQPDWIEFSQRHSINMPWLNDVLRRQISDFQRVLNAYYPTATDPTMSALKKATLRALSAWRYHLKLYSHPLELRALNRVLAYQRPETSGF